MSAQPPVALTIAGSDSGAGAGIQADLKAMAALGVHGTTAITAITAQNTVTVAAVHPLPPEVVEAQIDAVLDDFPVRAVKTGMLGTVDTIRMVGHRAGLGHLPRLVVDPVMVATTGRALLGEGGVDAYRTYVLPHALVVTPNLPEAALLAGVEAATITSVEAMVEVGRRIRQLGPTWVLVKGGHLSGADNGGSLPSEVPDVLTDGSTVEILRTGYVSTPNTHGTGCTLSAAIAAQLALDADVPHGVAEAARYVHRALIGGASWHLGRDRHDPGAPVSHGPLDHFGWSGRHGSRAAGGT